MVGPGKGFFSLLAPSSFCSANEPKTREFSHSELAVVPGSSRQVLEPWHGQQACRQRKAWAERHHELLRPEGVVQTQLPHRLFRRWEHLAEPSCADRQRKPGAAMLQLNFVRHARLACWTRYAWDRQERQVQRAHQAQCLMKELRGFPVDHRDCVLFPGIDLRQVGGLGGIQHCCGGECWSDMVRGQDDRQHRALCPCLAPS